jgi:hypothetical protein
MSEQKHRIYVRRLAGVFIPGLGQRNYGEYFEVDKETAALCLAPGRDEFSSDAIIKKENEEPVVKRIKPKDEPAKERKIDNDQI